MKTVLQYLAIAAFAILISAGASLPEAPSDKPVQKLAYSDMHR